MDLESELKTAKSDLKLIMAMWEAEKSRGDMLSRRLRRMREGARRIFRFYADVLKDDGVKEGRSTEGKGLEHSAWMCEEALKTNADVDKLHRWLGYVQCLLVSSGRFELDELREHVRNGP